MCAPGCVGESALDLLHVLMHELVPRPHLGRAPPRHFDAPRLPYRISLVFTPLPAQDKIKGTELTTTN